MLTPDVRPIGHIGPSPHAPPATIVKRYAVRIVPAGHGSVAAIVAQPTTPKLH